MKMMLGPFSPISPVLAEGTNAYWGGVVSSAETKCICLCQLQVIIETRGGNIEAHGVQQHQLMGFVSRGSL